MERAMRLLAIIPFIVIFVIIITPIVYKPKFKEVKKPMAKIKKIEIHEDEEFKKLKEEWLKFEPKDEKDLFNFIHKLTTRYENDYGTCVTMCVALMKAVFNYMDKLEGFTGFQVGFMQWLALREIFGNDDKIGLRLQRCEELLYPQLVDRFSHIKLNKKQCDKLKAMAQENIEKYKDQVVADKVRKHWNKLACGWLPSCVVKEQEPNEEEEKPNEVEESAKA